MLSLSKTTRNNNISTTDFKKPIFKIIAVGNDLYGDDGIGTAILNELENVPNMENVELINAATDALGIIDHLKDADHVIIIDAAHMGEVPGTVRVFEREDVNVIKMDHLSVHGISLAETFDIAETVDSMPKKLTIIGIEPKNIGISENLSNEVTQSMPQVVSRIINLTNVNNSFSGGNYA